jgi:hypothetical protein
MSITASCDAAGKIDTRWNGLAETTTSDYISVAEAGSDPSDYVTYSYNPDGKPSGTVVVDATGYLTAGSTYVVRYVLGSTSLPTAESTSFLFGEATPSAAGGGDDVVVDSVDDDDIKVEIKTGADGAPVPPECIAWVSGMPDAAMKAEQARNYAEQTLAAQITAYEAAGPSCKSMLDDVRRQRAECLAYAEAIAGGGGSGPAAASPAADAASNPIASAMAESARIQAFNAAIEGAPKPGPYMRKIHERFGLLAGDLESFLRRQETPAALALIERVNAAGGASAVADALKTATAYLLFASGGGSGVDEAARAEMTAVLSQLVASSREKRDWTGPDGSQKFSALLLLSHLASYWKSEDYAKMPASPHVEAVKGICASRMEEITTELQGVEAAMRADGSYDALLALTDGQAVAKSGPQIRNDDVEALGSHPEFSQNEAAWRRKPVKAFGFFYSEVTPEIFASLDDDMKEVAVHMMLTANGMTVPGTEGFASFAIPHPVPAKAAAGETLQVRGIVNCQPYILWQLKMARRINRAYQAYVKAALGDLYEGDPAKVPIKGFPRCKEKQEEKYTPEKFAMPSAAVMGDVVRCLCVCPTPESLRGAMAVVRDKFKVTRVKNGFAESEPAYGFRQVLINVLFTDDAASRAVSGFADGEPSGLTMVCEIQLNLASYVHVKHMIHKLYTICRCEDNASFRPDLYAQVLKKATPF